MSNINTDQMSVVAEVFQGAYSHVLSNTIGDSKAVVTEFIGKLVLQDKPYLLVTDEGVKRAIKLVFTNETIRDYVMMVAYTFFARWGGSEHDYVGLAGNLARGASAGRGFRELTAVPDVILNRLSDTDTVKSLLEANQWLMVLLMFQLFVTVLEETGRTK